MYTSSLEASGILIVLWCYAVTDKKKGSDHEEASQKTNSRKRSRHLGKLPRKLVQSVLPQNLNMKRDACKQKLTEVEGIVVELKEKHGSIEQLNAWAHMLHLSKHSPYGAPPDLPYFGKPHQSTSSAEPTTSAQQLPKKSTSDLSPCKCIQLCSECINQLDRWHSLYWRFRVSSTMTSKRIFSLTCLGLRDMLH